jgi:predicted ATPase
MIESLRLDCFKNFRSATLNTGPLTVLVGTNASGKSNLRDAFRFVHGMSRGYTLAEIIGEKYVEGGVLQWKGIRGGTRETPFFGSDRFGLETRIRIPNAALRANGHGNRFGQATHRIEVELGDRQKGPRVTSECFVVNQSTSFDSSPVDDPPAQEEPEYLFVRLPGDDRNRKHGKRLRFLSSQPVISQFAERRDAGRSRKDAECFVTELQSMRFLDLAPDAMKAPSLPGQLILGDRGENLSSVLQAICEDKSRKEALVEWVRQLTPLDVSDFRFVADQTGRVLVTLVESNGQETSAYSASDGTLRFLAMIAAFMGPDSAGFYFLEELDNGIHPTRLGLLLQLIEQHTRAGRIQIVATTHSPLLLGLLSASARENAVLVYRRENETEAHIQRIMEIPSARAVLESQNLSRLHESGWLENVVAFSQPEDASA